MSLRLLFNTKVAAIISLVFFGSSIVTQNVYALDTPQKNIYRNSIHYYNNSLDNSNTTCSDAGGDGSVTDLVGSDNVQRAYNYFVGSRQLSPQAAAGIIGNLIAESGVNPNSVQPSGYGHGIAQWETVINGKGSGRWDVKKPVNGKVANVKDFAASTEGAGREMTDLSLQLDFLWHELRSFYSGSLTKIQAATTAGDAAYIFMSEYEVPGERSPGGANDQNRRKLADDVFARYAGDTAPTEGDNGDDASGSACSASDVTTNCDGQAVTGKAAILCEARKFDPFGYAWGGGHEDPENFMKKFNAAGGYTQPFKQYVDCSGLITVSLWNAFKVKVTFSTSTMGSNGAFREIPIAQTQPGDFVWRPGHVEIVASAGANTTFGAHTSHTAPARQISDAKKQSWSKGYEYIGAASN
jgi:hypothetical protein